MTGHAYRFMETIAVIDNDKDSCDLLQLILENEGHTVQQFTSGKEFLATFKPNLFRLILMDLAMPDLDGYKLLEIVRREDPSIPVVAVTARAYQPDRDRARAAGFSDFVTKPFTDLPEFFQIVLKHLRENEPTTE